MEGCVYYIRQCGWGSLECLICIQWHSVIGLMGWVDGLMGGLTEWRDVFIILDNMDGDR